MITVLLIPGKFLERLIHRYFKTKFVKVSLHNEFLFVFSTSAQTVICKCTGKVPVPVLV
jgi:hypothetical protein